MSEAGSTPTGRLGPEPPLRDRVLSHLRDEGSDSISGIARTLSIDRHKPIHRLTIAGYLQALAEAGILREVERPPSKHYQLANPETHLSLHQRTGRIVQEMELPLAQRVPTLVAILNRLLGRPIFRAEIEHAGFPVMLGALQHAQPDEDQRRVYRALLKKRPNPHIDIPRADPLFLPPTGPDAVPEARIQDILRRLILEATGSTHLVPPPRAESPHHQPLEAFE